MTGSRVLCAVVIAAGLGWLALAPACDAAVPRVYRLTGSEPAPEDNFGAAVAVAPPYVLVGSPAAEDALDWAALHDFVTGAHLRTFLNPTQDSEDDQTFGSSVALVGPFAIVGQPGLDQIHVFDLVTGMLLRTIANPFPALASGFGARLVTLGVEVVVGTWGDVVHRIDPWTGGHVRTYANPLPPGDGRGGPIALMPPGDVLAVMSVPGGSAVHMFDGVTGTRMRTYTDPAPGTGSRFGASLATLGDEVLVGAPGDGEGAVHVFGTFDSVLRSFRNPSGIPAQNFGVSVASTDGFVVVGAPDAAGQEDGQGTAWLFNGPSGAVLSEIPNPSPDFEDFYGSPVVAVAGRAFITSPSGRSDDHGAVDAFAIGCGNGVVDAGETCDDGNAESGDGCDANCTPTACGNAIQTAGEACDDGNDENEDACTNACRQNVCGDGVLFRHIELCDDGNRDDGDGCDFNCRPSLCEGGVQLENVRVTLRNLGGVFGDERAIFRAHLPLPPDDFDPARDGLSVQVLDAEDPIGFGMNGILTLSPLGLFGAALPATAPDSGCGGPDDGWRQAGGLRTRLPQRLGPVARRRDARRSASRSRRADVSKPWSRSGGRVAAPCGSASRRAVPRLGFPRNHCTPPSRWAPRSAPGLAGRCGLWVSERCTTSSDGSTMRCR